MGTAGSASHRWALQILSGGIEPQWLPKWPLSRKPTPKRHQHRPTSPTNDSDALSWPLSGHRPVVV